MLPPKSWSALPPNLMPLSRYTRPTACILGVRKEASSRYTARQQQLSRLLPPYPIHRSILTPLSIVNPLSIDTLLSLSTQGGFARVSPALQCLLLIASYRRRASSINAHDRRRLPSLKSQCSEEKCADVQTRASQTIFFFPSHLILNLTSTFILYWIMLTMFIAICYCALFALLAAFAASVPEAEISDNPTPTNFLRRAFHGCK
jgi:hypothetical protein